MNPHERDEDAVRRLADCGYEVSSEGQCYIVCHRTDLNDVSRCDSLAQLADLADLMEWAEQRRAEKSPSGVRLPHRLITPNPSGGGGKLSGGTNSTMAAYDQSLC